MKINKINSSASFKTGVLFLIFNRPDTTKLVFERIRQVKPRRLYVAGDGPRQGYDDEKDKVKKARKIATTVDWPCEVKTLFRDKNLGCKKAISSAITWFFKHEEQGVILEDDCVPHLDFFTFCENLLNRYIEDERVLAITGNNFQKGKQRGEASYYFSKYSHIWGWATWKRSWQNYDGDIKFWANWRNSKSWLNYMHDKVERRYWKNIFDLTYLKKINTWDYSWIASVWYKNGLTATPNVNLVSNIGFREGSTHTHFEDDKNANLPIQKIGKIIHPTEITHNIEADKYTFDNSFNGLNHRFPQNLYRLPKKIIRYFFNNFNFLKQAKKSKKV